MRPADVSPIRPGPVRNIRKGEVAFLDVELSSGPLTPAGVALLDPETDQLYLRVRRDWSEIAGDPDAEVLPLVAEDLLVKAGKVGGRAILDQLADSSSNTLRISDREEILLSDFEARLNRLYSEYVRPRVLEFRTHLPLYTCEAAAGKFGAEMESEPEGWVEAPEGLRLSPDLFVVRVTGHSMEPYIPDGALCIFRRNPQGSRVGRKLLIENLMEINARYTVKYYISEKQHDSEGWRHKRIVMRPLNPDREAYPEWELDDSQFRVLGEFVRVMPGLE